MTDETAIEAEIQAKGLTAPRITPEHIDACIIQESYLAFEDRMIVAVLTLKNGFQVTGESACVSPENFNQEIGQKIARAKARDKIWALEAYRLKSELGRST